MIKYFQSRPAFFLSYLMWRDCKLSYCKLLSCIFQQGSDSQTVWSVSPLCTRDKDRDRMTTIHRLRDRGSYERIIFYLWPHWECVNLVKRRLSYRHEDVNNGSHVGNQGSMGIISSELTLVQSPTWLCLKTRIIDILQDLPRALCYEVIWSSRRSIQKQSASDSRAMEERKRWMRIQRKTEVIKSNRKFCQSRCEMKMSSCFGLNVSIISE